MLSWKILGFAWVEYDSKELKLSVYVQLLLVEKKKKEE